MALCAALSLVVGCDPGSCQGAVDNDPNTDGIQGAPDVDDQVLVVPLCEGQNDQVIGDVDISTRAELEALANCRIVQGSIILHDSRDIVDLGPLAGLTQISKGYFLAFNNEALGSVALPAVTSIDYGFAAIDNPALTSIQLPGLVELLGDLTIRSAPLLTTLSFAALQEVKTDGQNGPGTILLGDLPGLTSLQGFQSLSRIEGSLQVFGTGLRNFQGLESLQEVLNVGALQTQAAFRVDKLNPGLAIGIDFDQDFNIVDAGNPALEDFSGLDNLATLNGDVVVGFNDGLQNFEGLDDVKNIVGNVYVMGNDSLQSFRGLDGDANGDNNDDGLTTISGNLYVGVFFDRFGQPIAGGNASLENLDGLDQLTSISGKLVLGFNGSLANLAGLDSLATLGGDLVIVGSRQLQDLKGAPLLTTIGGSLVLGELVRNDGVFFNPDEEDPELQLVDLAGQLQDPGIALDLAAGQNGFEALTTVQKDLVVAFSDLENLQFSDPDTASLTTVAGRIILHGNQAPTSLAGLETVASLGGLVVNFGVDAVGNLVPSANEALTSLAGLTVTALGAQGLHLGFDTTLESLAGLPAFTQIGGSVTIAGIDEETDLVDLAGLQALSIGGDLIVGAIRNADAAPIDATLGNVVNLNLTGVTTVGGDVLIAFLDDLTTTTTALHAVTGTLEFTNNSALTTMAGLDALAAVGTLDVHDATNLTQVQIPSLLLTTADVRLARLPQLTTFTLGVTSVGGTVQIEGCPDLIDLNGLQSLTTVTDDVRIIDATNLQNTLGLSQLQTVGGSLVLRRLPQITNEAVAGGANELNFAVLTTVGGSLELTGMDGLQDLAGLDALASIGESLIIENNAGLTTLFGLQSLASIGEKLRLVNNPLLHRLRFDDDNLDREVDIADPDATFEAGLVALLELGSPVFDGDILIGGSTGVAEVRNNAALSEGELEAVLANFTQAYEGFLLVCGNVDSTDDNNDPDNRVFATAVCPADD